MDQSIMMQIVARKDVTRTISAVKLLQKNFVALNDKTSPTDLNSTYKEIYKMIGTVDTLKALDLLEDDVYQNLVEQNVMLEDKIRRLIKEKKPNRPRIELGT